MSKQNFESIVKEFQVHLENILLRLLVYLSDINPHFPKDAIQSQPLHNHVAAELFVNGHGSFIIKTEEGYITLNKGDAIIIPPGIYHRLYQIDNDAVVYSLFFLCHKKSSNNKDAKDIHSILLPFFTNKQITVYRNKPQLFEGVKKIISELETPLSFMPALHLFELLILALSLEAETSAVCDKSLDNISKTDDMHLIVALETLIESNYMNDWKIDDFADKLFISRRQLDRIVKKRYGMTFHQIIMKKRLENAERLLLSSDMTVEKIAVIVGFDANAGFYREFAKRYGVTPAKYRKQSKINP